MKLYYLGIDIGGSHISGALVDSETDLLVAASYQKTLLDSNGPCDSFIKGFQDLIEKIINDNTPVNLHQIGAVGISMPGPFNYKDGISEINGVKKYDSLFGLNVKQEIKKIVNNVPVYFLNDAESFAIGEYGAGVAMHNSRSIVLTLGTGFGCTYLIDGCVQSEEKNGVPPNGYLYNIPFKDGIADDYFSTRWFVKKWNELDREKVHTVKEITILADDHDSDALSLFDEFTENFIQFMTPWILKFQPESLVLGGGIAKASHHFLDQMTKKIHQVNKTEIHICKLWDKAAIMGAALHANNSLKKQDLEQNKEWRKTQQYLAPEKKENNEISYDAYPSFSLGENKIKAGIEEFASWIEQHKIITIDGYLGVFWSHLVESLSAELKKRGKTVRCFHVDAAMKSSDKLDEMLVPYLGGDDPLFGKITDKNLIDWFDTEKLKLIKPDTSADINIILGCGASLAQWQGPIVYFDLPKNELQFRARAGMVNNLGSKNKIDNRRTYKRFFFVDWVVLNKHKNEILPDIDLIADEQRPNNYLFMTGDALRAGLSQMAKNVFRPRPWFEPGAWGGTWMKEQMEGLNKEVDNLAWSFELMVLENGIMFESDQYLLEVSFDFLMFNNYKEVLGDCAEKFKHDFPIRFDFLDTFDGGNLSIQCHPTPEYIREHFGMPFTQDETYYILDCKNEPLVYLGFQDGVKPEEFHKALLQSQKEVKELDVDKYIQKFTAKKHDLFLIPNGTIHASGSNNLVLEISSAPYIFTFKMYDWLRLDLDGKPRPLNIEHGMRNVDFERKGDSVVPELISVPYIINQTEEYTLEHLPTHPEHFYDVHRYTLNNKIHIPTNNKCHVWMLIEGTSVIIKTKNGIRQRFNYAETFVVPASAESYTIYNENPNNKTLLIQAFVK
ncbi:ROK family protein [Flavobacterium cupreum]|uniref:ROK family protein n=1 Tax=Flavobacterium cupreum TaxID=2133766 RepID=A0A434ACR3_9FLAO|nr:ROK family protein [Flavobacterium cupreum]RUT72162.1 ROK family protein [Flavobacterium cupreum]